MKWAVARTDDDNIKRLKYGADGVAKEKEREQERERE